MDYPVMLRSDERGYTATALFWPEVRVRAATREAALDAARNKLTEQLAATDVVMVEVPGDDPWLVLAGKYAEDDSLRGICAEAYSERDRQLVG